MLLKNSTDIPNLLIYKAVENGLQEGVELDTIIVKNKKVARKYVGSHYGNWGWYYVKHPDYGRCVSVSVPRVIHKPIVVVRKDLGFLTYTMDTRIEFLVKVMAHELRHAYQFQVANTGVGSTKRWRETDCHVWEYKSLMKWRRFIDNLKAASNAKSG